MRYANGATHQVGDGKDLKNLLPADAKFMAGAEVVADAVVAAQHHRGDEAEEFLGFHIQGPRFVAMLVEGKEAVERLVVLGKSSRSSVRGIEILALSTLAQRI